MRTSFLRPDDPAPPPRIKTDEIKVPAPKEIDEAAPLSKVRTIGVPILMLVVLGGMVAMMMRTGRFNPMYMMFPLFMIMGMGSMMHGQSGGGGTSRAQLLADRKAQTRGLARCREKVFDRGLSMHRGLQHAFPDPVMLPALIGTDRMWEVVPTADGYTQLRYGLGEVELAARVIPPEAGPGEFLEPASLVATLKFLRHHTTASSMPLAVAAHKFPIIGFAGDREVSVAMLRAMALHAAVTHGPENLAIVALTDDPDATQWSWLKWLPHARHPFKIDQLGDIRMLYSSWTALIEDLEGKEPDDPRLIDFSMNFDPHVEFSDDNYRHVLVIVDSAFSDKLIDSAVAPRAGVTWMMVNPPENALTAHEGLILRCDPDRTVWRTRADEPRAEPVKVAVADQVSLLDAHTTARRLARYEPASLKTLDYRTNPVERGRDWATLMRVRDPGAVDPLETWSAITRYDDPRRLRIPIAFLSNGDRLDLDIKQAAEGGTGPHGQLLGTTGSGKSEFLRNMILNACVTHSPEKLNWLLVDFKGGAAFLGMADLPHVTAVITNMEEEAHLVSRMREMIIGEIDRRLGILREANKLNPRYDVQDIGSYERLRERGVDLDPMPALVIIVDEFTELLTKHSDYGPIFTRIGRLGRSVGIHLLFASQNLDISGRTTGLESNIGYKIGLKTQTPQESRALLNNSDAAFRLPGTPGHGILLPTAGPRVGENIQFYAGFTGAPYFPPAPEVVPDKNTSSTPTDKQDTAVPPRLFTATTVPFPDADEAPMVIEEPQRSDEELQAADSIFTTVVERIRSAKHPPPYRMWLPPLEVVTLDEVEPSLGRWAAPSSGVLPRLCVPMGLFDEPVKHAQPLWTVDTADQNVLIVGGAQLGKSTVVKTLVCSLALHNTPEQVQMYLVDYSGGGLGPLADLPHVGGFATRADPDGINRILSQMSTLIQDRAQVFRRHGIATMADYRRLRTDPRSPLHAEDKYGDVFIVIDGWDAATSEGQVLQYRGSEIEALIAGALNYGVHLVLATSRTVEMRGIEPHMKTVIELHTDEFSRVDSGLAKARRPDPGHVVTTRSSLQGLVALPRIDGCADRDSINAGMQALVDGVREEFANRAAERLRTLPTSLTYEQLAELVAAADQRAAQRGTADDPRRRLRIPFGIGEERLTPAYAEMWYEPHLLFLGQPKSGKSECLGAFYDAITRKFTGGVDEAAVIFYDPVRRHLGRLDEANLFAYVTTDEELAQATVDLDQRYDIQSRSLPADIDAETRAARSWWQGPEVFIIVDDEQFVGAQVLGEKPFIEQLAPWAFNEPLARGLHFVIARTTDDLGIASYRDQILKRMLSEMVPTVMLSAKKFDGQIGDQKFENFGIPGRGRYIQASQGRKERIQAAWSGHHLEDMAIFDDD